MKITSCSAFLTLLPPRPIRTLVKTTSGSRTALTGPAPRQRDPGPGRGSRLAQLFRYQPLTPDSLPASQLSLFPRAPRRVLPQLQGMRGNCRRPDPEVSAAGDTPAPGTAARSRRFPSPAQRWRPLTLPPTCHSASRPHRLHLPLFASLLGSRSGRGCRLTPGNRQGRNFVAERGAGCGALPPSPRPPQRREPAALPRRAAPCFPASPSRPAAAATDQGSNSWMMLSKRMTAKSRELNPASQARKRMVKESRDCQPAGCDRPPDRPPPAPARLWSGAAELAAGLCLWSGAECSAMLYPGLPRSLSLRPARAGRRRRRRGGEEGGRAGGGRLGKGRGGARPFLLGAPCWLPAASWRTRALPLPPPPATAVTDPRGRGGHGAARASPGGGAIHRNGAGPRSRRGGARDGPGSPRGSEGSAGVGRGALPGGAADGI